MRNDQMRQSENVEDRRGASRTMVAGGGLGGIGVVIVLLYLVLGGNPQALLQPGGPLSPGAPTGGGSGGQAVPANDAAARLVASILGDTEDVWRAQFKEMGRQYQEPTLVLFSGEVDSACGIAGSAVGPFYCPSDRRVYIDLEFFNELGARYGAPGDFAQAYVIAHEVGHHVQNLLGISARVSAQQARASVAEANALSVRLELQADFLAGVWAHHADKQRRVLEPGDIEEGLRAAAAVGDDRLQRQAQGRVAPESFTHGTSAQRVRWFRLGLETGDVSRGDTFGAASP